MKVLDLSGTTLLSVANKWSFMA